MVGENEQEKARPEEIRGLQELIEVEPYVPDNQSEPSSLDRVLSISSRQIFISERTPAYWSRERDRILWELMVQSDMLSSAIFITSARLFSVPFNIIPRNKSNRRHREIAYWSDLLLKDSWEEEMFPFIIDWQTQDNGAFMEIVGGGNPTGPIEPTLIPGTETYLYGLGFRHLDSQKCTRTGHPDFPVKVTAKNKQGKTKEYKLHHSRVLFMSQMPSPRVDMLGVGFSAVSRCISHVHHLNDIDILKEEWLGSRPVSEIIFGKGLTNAQIEEAFTKADEKAHLEGNRRYAKLVFLGLGGNADMIRASAIERIPLKRLPDGYNEEQSITVAINVIAMALGFDARTLWPATVRGATRADAAVQHQKMLKMTPGIWVEGLTKALTKKFCPITCIVTADQQDDEQDQIVGENQQLRANVRQVMLASGQIDLKTCYEMMLRDGDLSEDQYEYMTLQIAKLEEQLHPKPASPGADGSPADGDGDGIEEEASASVTEPAEVTWGTVGGLKTANGNGRH